MRDFYQFMVDNPAAYPKTSLPSLEDFETVFRAHAEAGRPVLCICFTSKMSGCVGSARNARELVLEDFPDAKIEVIDSTAATVTESIVVENAVVMRDAGCTLDEAVTWLEAERPPTRSSSRWVIWTTSSRAGASAKSRAVPPTFWASNP